MARTLRPVATVIATIGLLAASVSAVSAGPVPPRGDGPWYVYPADGCWSSGCTVVVTKQSMWKGNSTGETCTKDATYPDTQCNGSRTYVREYIGAPWKVQ